MSRTSLSHRHLVQIAAILSWTIVAFCFIVAVCVNITATRHMTNSSEREVIMSFAGLNLSTPRTLHLNGAKHHDLRNSAVATDNSSYFPPHVNISALPTWIQRYVAWHRSMRAQYPGDSLLHHPDAPLLLIRTCTVKCGGLHDRLGKLPWDLYLANATGRLLLMHWCQPSLLQDFLQPMQLDWTVPQGLYDLYRGSDACSRHVQREMKDLFDGFRSGRPRSDFWSDHMFQALERAKHGIYAKEKVLRHSLLGQDAVLSKLLLDAGETDTIQWTQTFPNIFWFFFQPSPKLAIQVEHALSTLGAKPGEYTATHCRVRHPGAAPQQAGPLKSKRVLPGGPDRAGLSWLDTTSRLYAVQVALHALRCTTQMVLQQPTEPIFFYADSEDLVRYLTRELNDPTFVASNMTLLQSNPVDAEGLRIVQNANVLKRPSSNAATLHLDRQIGFDPESYFATFVDLFVASQARCHVVGVGNYGTLAAKLSGRHCVVQHQTDARGDDAFVDHSMTVACRLDESPM